MKFIFTFLTLMTCILQTSCNKDVPTKKEETTFQFDERDKFTGIYKCLKVYMIYNSEESRMDSFYDTIDLNVEKYNDSNHISVNPVGIFKFVKKDSSLHIGSLGSSSAASWGKFYPKDSIYIKVDYPGLGPRGTFYYGKKQ